jgi:hypothetical protein
VEKKKSLARDPDTDEMMPSIEDLEKRLLAVRQ